MTLYQLTANLIKRFHILSSEGVRTAFPKTTLAPRKIINEFTNRCSPIFTVPVNNAHIESDLR